MFCPKCRAEFREGFNICSDCRVALVETQPLLQEDIALITVFKSGDPFKLGIAKSILDYANITYFIKDELAQNLVGIGIMGTGYNPVIGPAQIQVSREDEKEALELLKDII